jgi:hypothetical protein
MTSIWLKRSALACVVGALVLGACGGDDDDDVAADTGDSTTTVEETTPATDEPAEDDPVVEAGTEDYVGLTVEEAGAKADDAGVVWRVVSEDGEDLAVTMDFQPERLNFTVVDGVVTGVTLG